MSKAGVAAGIEFFKSFLTPKHRRSHSRTDHPRSNLYPPGDSRNQFSTPLLIQRTRLSHRTLRRDIRLERHHSKQRDHAKAFSYSRLKHSQKVLPVASSPELKFGVRSPVPKRRQSAEVFNTSIALPCRSAVGRIGGGMKSGSQESMGLWVVILLLPSDHATETVMSSDLCLAAVECHIRISYSDELNVLRRTKSAVRLIATQQLQERTGNSDDDSNVQNEVEIRCYSRVSRNVMGVDTKQRNEILCTSCYPMMRM